MIAVRYLDISVVLAAGVFVVLAGLPVIGWALVGAAWIVMRLSLDYVDGRLERRGAGVSARIGTHFAGMMARVLIVALAVVAARYIGDRDDGVMGAVVALIALHRVSRRVIRRPPVKPEQERRPSMTLKQKLWAGAGVYIGGVVVIVALTGWHRTDNKGVPAAERVQARHLVQRRPDRLQQGRDCT